MKISVLIATYNREHLLAECLSSLAKQTFKDFEVIVVDDGSTDNTKRFNGLVDTYYLQGHKGISAARNKALELAQGEYYFVLDSDDTLEPTCLQKYLEVAEKHHSDIVVSYYGCFGAKKSLMRFEKQTLRECLTQKKIPHCGLYRMSTLGKYRYDEKFKSAVDYDYILQILESNPKVKIDVIPVPLYNYRIGHKQEAGSIDQRACANIIRERYNKRI